MCQKPAATLKPADVLSELADSILVSGHEATAELELLALLLAQAAWNKALGVEIQPAFFEGLREAEAGHEGFWSSFRDADVHRLLDRMIELKESRYPGERRGIVRCRVTSGGVVEAQWLDLGDG